MSSVCERQREEEVKSNGCFSKRKSQDVFLKDPVKFRNIEYNSSNKNRKSAGLVARRYNNRNLAIEKGYFRGSSIISPQT